MTVPASAGEAVIARAAAGGRVLTARGAGMRVMSVVSNLALIALVAPTDLGLLAVVRGITGMAGNSSDLGFAWALLRRPEAPTADEYRALAGLQLFFIVVFLAVVLLLPAQVAALAAIPAEWTWWMVAVLATMLTVPMGTSARIRLERSMDYRRIAWLDLTSVLLQNVLLLVFAATGYFAPGVFLATGATLLYSNLLLWFWSPGPYPGYDLRAWRRLGREFAGFSAGHVGSLLYNTATPILIAHLLGLSAAGIWAFATRLGNVLQLAFEGFRRAVVPAAAQLVRSRGSLRRLVQGSLDSAAALTIPLMAAMYAGLPLLGRVLPRWDAAVVPAQLFVICFGASGLLAASLVPAGVAMQGARIILVEQFAPVLVGWTGFALLRALGRDEIAWVIPPMFAALAAALWLAADAAVRPAWNGALRQLASALVFVIVITTAGQLFGIHPLLAAILAGCGFLIVGGRATPLMAPHPAGGRRAW